MSIILIDILNNFKNYKKKLKIIKIGNQKTKNKLLI